MNNRILVVDDDPVFAQVLTRALNKRGLEAQAAYSSEEALRLQESFAADRATLDLRMAEESGLQLLPHLLDQHPKLRVVVLTGYSSIATAVQAIKLGAANYLCKPATADEVLAAFTTEVAPEMDVQENQVSVNRLEWEYIQKVLSDNEGNVSATARALGMHRRTLQRKLQKRPVRR